MKWDQIEWTAARGNEGGRGRGSNGLVSISQIKGGKGTKCVRIGIPKKAMQAMAWRVGDRVDIFYAFSDNLIAIVRTSEDAGRCALTGSGKRQRGTVESCAIQFSPSSKREHSFLPSNLSRCKWQPEERGLVVNVPFH